MNEEIWLERSESLKVFDGKGISAVEIAEETGLSVITVRNYAKRFGFDFRAGTCGRSVSAETKDRLEEIRKLAENGYTRKEVANLLGIGFATVGRIARQYSVSFRHALSGRNENGGRAEAMASMYQGGKTLEEIGSVFGLSRERVRQVISKNTEITSKDGGQSVRARNYRAAKAARRDKESFKRYGCTYEQYRSLVALGREQKRCSGGSHATTPTGAFNSQRRNALSRDLEWNLNLWEWWNIWVQSGKWDCRGRGKGHYVMCRFGDVGAYEAGNVYIARFEHNVLFQPNNPYRKGHPDHEKVMKPIREKLRDRARRDRPEVGSHGLPVGVYRRGSKYLAQLSISGKVKYLGTFATVQSAEEEVLRALADITGRIAA